MIIRDEQGGLTSVDKTFVHQGWPCVPGDIPHNCEEARAKRMTQRGVIILRAGPKKESYDHLDRRSPTD